MSSPGGLLHSLKTTLEKREASGARRRLSIAVNHSVDFSSNDFLSLSTSPVLRSTYHQELYNASHVPLGSGGSRLLDGNSLYAEQLEHEIASFHHAPSGLLFNSGFDANSGMFACLPQHGDVIVYDEYIHASVHEGMRLSRATARHAFAHNDVADFARIMQHLASTYPSLLQGTHNVFVAVESVYSMDGDIAPIQAILDLKDRLFPAGNAHLIVDEAHSTGVYGPQGRGIVSLLGVEDQILARLHTFGKALSSGGAIILCHPTLREFLINYARSLIYTTALGLPTLAMIKSVYRLLQTGQTEEAQDTLWHLIGHLHSRLLELPPSSSLVVSKDSPKSPIFSLITHRPRDLAAYCQARGLVVRPIVPPTVPEGGQRVRVCLHAGNTIAEIDRLVDCLVTWLDSLQAPARL